MSAIDSADRERPSWSRYGAARPISVVQMSGFCQRGPQASVRTCIPTNVAVRSPYDQLGGPLIRAVPMKRSAGVGAPFEAIPAACIASEPPSDPRLPPLSRRARADALKCAVAGEVRATRQRSA